MYYENADLDKFCREILEHDYGDSSTISKHDKIWFVFNKGGMHVGSYAEVKPIKGVYTLLTDVHYIVVFNWYVWEVLTPEQREVLVKHELMHIPLREIEKFANRKTRKHEIKDFRTILKTYGIDWVDDKESIKRKVKEIKQRENEQEKESEA